MSKTKVTTIVLSAFNIAVFSLFSVLKLSDAEITAGILFGFIVILNILNVFATATDKLQNLENVNLMLLLTTFSAISYVYTPDFLIAAASIVGVSSFLYLVIERVIYDSIE